MPKQQCLVIRRSRSNHLRSLEIFLTETLLPRHRAEAKEPAQHRWEALAII